MNMALATYDDNNFFFPHRNKGASHCSEKLDKMVQEAYRHINKPVSRQAKFSDVIGEFNEMLSECSKENWDGYGAHPLKTAAILEGLRFITSIPKWLPLPEIVPENTGDLGFQWDFGKRKKFAISLRGNNSISYAGLLGAGSKVSGMENYNGTLPKIVAESLKRIVY